MTALTDSAIIPESPDSIGTRNTAAEYASFLEELAESTACPDCGAEPFRDYGHCREHLTENELADWRESERLDDGDRAYDRMRDEGMGHG